MSPARISRRLRPDLTIRLSGGGFNPYRTEKETMSQFANYIDGQWVDGASVSRNVNPSNLDDVVGEFAQADAEQTQRAIGAARKAFAQWSLSTPQQRFDLLDQVGSTILARKAELGRLLAREEGKTLPEAIGEV